MVFAAPLFLFANTARWRAQFSANKPALVTFGLSMTISWLALRLLSKSYETEQRTEEAAAAEDDKRVLLALMAHADVLASVRAAHDVDAARTALTTAAGAALREAKRARADAAAAATPSFAARAEQFRTIMAPAAPSGALQTAYSQRAEEVALPPSVVPPAAATPQPTAAATAAVAAADVKPVRTLPRAGLV